MRVARRTRSRQADQPLDLRRAVRRHVRPQRPACSTRRRGSSRARWTSRRSRRSIDAVQAAKAAFPAWRALSIAKRAEILFAIRELVHERREEIAKHLTAEHGKVLSDAMGEVTRGLEVIEFCLRHPASAEGRHDRAGVDGRRRVLDPPAARRRRRHHAVQLPGDGSDVDVGAGARLREHVRPQAVGEGSLGVGLHGAAAEGGRRARRRLQRRPRRQGRGRRDPRAPRHRRDLVRRLDADREVRLRDGDRERQALPGARRREEPHDRAAGRRHRHGGRRRGLRRVRLGRRAVHGGVDARRRRRRRRPADRGDQGAHPERQGRRRHGRVERDGPADHARASRQGRVVPRGRRRRRCSSTVATAAPTTASSSRRR